jgi:hypothetical protein
MKCYIAAHRFNIKLPMGLEPMTLGLEVRCSIQLRYGNKKFPCGESNPVPLGESQVSLPLDYMGE